MNINSKLCIFISENENWREILKNDYGISIKEEYPLAIFNYGIESDFHNSIVQEARGIIIDIERLEVVCWPFRKFGNYNEDYADKIDWNTARVQEKIDGSIIKMWWNEITGEWQFSTNAMISAKDALANSLTGKMFYDLILFADNFGNLKYAIPALNKEYTFIFELVCPETQVVIKYHTTHLYHIGTRNNQTGVEVGSHFNIEWPKEYPLNSLDDCINAAIELNKGNDGKINSVKKEGFVVVDANWNRIKIKSPDYLMMHRMSSNSNFSKERIVELIRSKTVNVSDLCNDFPNFTHYIKFYDFKIAEFEHQAKVFCDLTRRIYEEYSHDRKAVAMVIKKHRFSAIGFMCLDSGKNGAEILAEMELSRYCKYIPDYQPERLSDLFYPEKETETSFLKFRRK